MAGKLVGLVIQHGPISHNAFTVAVVIAEDMHDAGDTALMSTDELARRTRLGRTSITNAVRDLRKGGWIRTMAGGGRGVASRYQLRLEAFPEECRETCRHAARIDELDLEKHAATRHVLAENMPPRGQNMPPRGTSTVPVGSPSATSPENMPPRDMIPMVVGVRTGPDDDLIRTALDTFRVTPSKTLRVEIGKALDRGWTASGINHQLRAEVDVRNCRDLVAVLVRVVRDLPTKVEPVQETGPECAECGLPESACRRRQKTSGHTFVSVADRVIVDVEKGMGAASGGADERKTGDPSTPEFWSRKIAR